MYDALREANPAVTRERVDALIRDFDENGDGEIQLDEFLVMMSALDKTDGGESVAELVKAKRTKRPARDRVMVSGGEMGGKGAASRDLQWWMLEKHALSANGLSQGRIRSPMYFCMFFLLHRRARGREHTR